MPCVHVDRRQVLVVVGTRPEAIKLAPVIRTLRARWSDSCDVTLCASGQHRELLDDALELFDLRPDLDLDIMRPGQSPAYVAAQVLTGLDSVLQRRHWHWVVVQGDTTTAAAAGLAAFYRGAPVAHVEAGLRTHRLDEPFPEEMNRRLVALSASLHFAPTAAAQANLLAEGIPESAVLVTGNTVIDAMQDVLGRATRPQVSALLEGLGLGAAEHGRGGGRRVLVTIHRRESLGSHLEEICRAIVATAQAARGKLRFIVATHPNPDVAPRMHRELARCEAVQVLPALPYDAFVHVLARCDLAVTDSGGVQEESAALGKPVLVVRDVTERLEGVEDGVSRVVGRSRERIVPALLEMIDSDERWCAMARPSTVYGDGRAAVRIAERLVGPIEPLDPEQLTISTSARARGQA